MMELGKYVCPKCGYTGERTDYFIPGMEITNSQYEGMYCINCYAEWLNKNITKMEYKGK